MSNPHEAALEAAARALDGTGLLEGDESRSASRASVEAYLAAMREVGFVVVPATPTLAMLELFGIHKATVARNYCELIAAAQEGE